MRWSANLGSWCLAILLGVVCVCPVWANSNDKPDPKCKSCPTCTDSQTQDGNCNCKCNGSKAGSGNASSMSVDLTLSLGDKLPSQMYEAGRIILHNEYPAANLAQAIALKMNSDKISSKVVYDSNHAISQIYAPQTFVQVHQTSTSSYGIAFFYPSQIGLATNMYSNSTNLVDSLAVMPYASWSVQSVGGGSVVTNLVIQGYVEGQLMRTIQYSWDSARNGWTMSEGDVQESVFFSDIYNDGSSSGSSNLFNGTNLFPAQGLSYPNFLYPSTTNSIFLV